MLCYDWYCDDKDRRISRPQRVHCPACRPREPWSASLVCVCVCVCVCVFVERSRVTCQYLAVPKQKTACCPSTSGRARRPSPVGILTRRKKSARISYLAAAKGTAIALRLGRLASWYVKVACQVEVEWIWGLLPLLRTPLVPPMDPCHPPPHPPMDPPYTAHLQSCCCNPLLHLMYRSHRVILSFESYMDPWMLHGPLNVTWECHMDPECYMDPWMLHGNVIWSSECYVDPECDTDPWMLHGPLMYWNLNVTWTPECYVDLWMLHGPLNVMLTSECYRVPLNVTWEC